MRGANIMKGHNFILSHLEGNQIQILFIICFFLFKTYEQKQRTHFSTPLTRNTENYKQRNHNKFFIISDVCKH